MKRKLMVILILSCMVLQLIPLSTAPSSPSASAAQEELMNRNGLLWMNVKGFTGYITTDILIEDMESPAGDDTILFGTTSGVYMLDMDTGDVRMRISVSSAVTSVFVIPDVDSDNHKEVGYTSTDQVRPNVAVYSGATGSKIWDYTPSERVYTSNLGWAPQETRSWDSIVIDTGQGNLVMVSSWRSVHCLDAGTGERLWKHSAKDDVWFLYPFDDIDGDGTKDLLSAGQDGKLRLFSSGSGRIIWKADLEDSYDFMARLAFAKLKFSSPKSLWNPVLVDDINGDGIDEIAIASEMGMIYMVDGSQGKTLWKEEVKDLKKSEKAESSGFTDDGFGSVVMKTVSDMDRDGTQDLCVLSIESGQEDVGSGSLSLLSGSENRGKRAISEKKSTPQFPLTGIGDFLVINDQNGDGLDDIAVMTGGELGIINVIGGNFSGSLFSHPFFEANSGEFDEHTRILPLVEGNISRLLITYGNQGILLVDVDTQSIVWDLLRKDDVAVSTVGDIDGGGLEDLLVTTYISYSGKRVRDIYAIASESGEVLWELTSSLEDIRKFSYQGIKVMDDVDGDGINDLCGFLQEEFGDGNGHSSYGGLGIYNLSRNSRVFIISAASGDFIWKKNLTAPFINSLLTPSLGLYGDSNAVFKRISNVEPVGDMNGDSVPDVLVLSEALYHDQSIPPKLYLLSGVTGKIVWIRGYSYSHGGGGGDGYMGPTTYLRSFYEGNGTVSWSSSRDGALGNGEEIETVLTSGKHTITALLKDGAAELDNHSIEMNVVQEGSIYSEINSESNVALVGEQVHLYTHGDMNYNYTWISDLQGFLSYDMDVWTVLSAGLHNITLTARDDSGKGAGSVFQDTFQLQVHPSPDPLLVLLMDVDGQDIRYMSHGSYVTENSQINMGVYDKQDEGNPLMDYDMVFESDQDGMIGQGNPTTASLSTGTHRITAKLYPQGNTSGSSLFNISMDVDVENHLDPTADINLHGQARLNDYLFRAHEHMNLDATSSSSALENPEEHTITDYLWEVDGQPAGNSSNELLYFNSSGFHTVSLTVFNELGRNSTSQRTIQVFEDLNLECLIGGADRGTTWDTLERIYLWSDSRNASFQTYWWESDLDGIVAQSSDSMNTFLSQGTHNITLYATTHSGITLSDTVKVKVDRGPDLIPYIDLPGMNMNFPDIVSNSPLDVNLIVNTQARNIDVDELNITWMVDGEIAAYGQDAQVPPIAPGEHVLEGVVAGMGQVLSHERYITVRGPGSPLVEVLSPDNVSAVQQDINFNYVNRGQVSVDNVTWTFSDGNISYDHSPFHYFDSPGNYTATLSALNETNQTYHNITVSFRVYGNGRPIPRFQLSPQLYLTTASDINFNAGTSYHRGADTIDNYTWDFGDGSYLAYGESINHFYSDPGTYNVRLTLRDTGGNSTWFEKKMKIFWAAHPLSTSLKIMSNTDPNFRDLPCAHSGDMINFSAELNYRQIPAYIYDLSYSSDRDGLLGQGDWVVTSLSSGLHTVSCDLTRDGQTVERMVREIFVYGSGNPVLSLNSWNDDPNFNYNGFAFPRGYRVQMDIQGSWASADQGLSASFTNISYTITGIDVNATPAVLYGQSVYHYFTEAGNYRVIIQAENDQGGSSDVWREVTVYETEPLLWITSPEVGERSGREGQSMQLSVNTNPNNQGFEGIEKLNITWTSDMDGVLGYGENIDGLLSKGAHNITVTVDNGYGLTSSRDITVIIIQGGKAIANIRNKREYLSRIYGSDENIGLYCYTPFSYSQAYSWTSNLDGHLGNSDNIQVMLSPGIHRITLETSSGPGSTASDEILLKVGGGQSLIVITDPRDGSYTWGIKGSGILPDDDDDGGQDPLDYREVNFLSREAHQSIFTPLSNGSHLLITTDWDRIRCGLISADGYTPKDPFWVFPDTFLDSLGSGNGSDEGEGEGDGGIGALNQMFPFIENIDANTLMETGDINDDGVKELSLKYWGSSGEGLIIIDTSTGLPVNLDPDVDMGFNELKDLGRYNIATYGLEKDASIFGEDINGDGFGDVLAFDKWSDDWELGSSIKAISGTDGSLIWEYKGLFGRVQQDTQNSHPVTFIDDMDNDGMKDVVVASVTDVLLLSGRDGTEMERYHYQKSPMELEDDNNPPPVSMINTVDDFSGDGKDDLVVLYQVEGQFKDITEMLLIETADYTPFRTFPLPAASILSSGDVNGDGLADIMLATSDLLFRLDSSFRLNILSPEEKKVKGDSVKVTWDKPDVRCEVLVDGISWGYFDEGEAELTLTGGEHRIEVRLTDDLGGTISDTIMVKVPGSILPTVINYTLLGILLILLVLSIVMPIIQRSKREKKIKRMKEKDSGESVEDREEFLMKARKNVMRVWTREKTEINISGVFFEDNEIEFDDDADEQYTDDVHGEFDGYDESALKDGLGDPPALPPPEPEEDWAEEGSAEDNKGGDWLD